MPPPPGGHPPFFFHWVGIISLLRAHTESETDPAGRALNPRKVKGTEARKRDSYQSIP